jgi:hypothetical protein
MRGEGAGQPRPRPTHDQPLRLNPPEDPHPEPDLGKAVLDACVRTSETALRSPVRHSERPLQALSGKRGCVLRCAGGLERPLSAARDGEDSRSTASQDQYPGTARRLGGNDWQGQIWAWQA